MKSRFVVFILLLVLKTLKVSAQMVVLNNRFLKVHQQGDSVLYKYSAKYKIKIDYKTGELFVQNKLIYKETTDSVSFYEILAGQYLVISFFGTDMRLSSAGRENAAKGDIMITSLKCPVNKFYFHLSGKCNAAGIVKFDEATGLLTIIKKNDATASDLSLYKKETVE